MISAEPVSRSAGGHSPRRPIALLGVLLIGGVLLGACGSGDASSSSTTTVVAAPAESAPDATTAPTQAPGRDYDLQGHRGARGLRPENTLPGFELALDLMVDTLELDLHLSADDVVIVWHDPIVDQTKCDAPAAASRLRDLTAAEIGAIRCVRNPDPGRFLEQTPDAGSVSGDDYTIPTLAEVFDLVDAYAADPSKTDEQRQNAATVRFNVETKRNPGDPAAIGDGFDGSSMGTFESALVATVTEAGMADRVTVQSFDHRSLWAIRAQHPEFPLAALTLRNVMPDFADLAASGATIWSPDYRSLTEAAVDAAHRAGLAVIPWTVNDPAAMAELLVLGVDGLITDRPDLAPVP